MVWDYTDFLMTIVIAMDVHDNTTNFHFTLPVGIFRAYATITASLQSSSHLGSASSVCCILAAALTPFMDVAIWPMSSAFKKKNCHKFIKIDMLFASNADQVSGSE